MHIKSPRVRPVQLAGQHPSAPTPARLRPPLHRSSPLLPAASTSYRAAASATVAPAAARGREAANPPAVAQHAVEDAHALTQVVLELELVELEVVVVGLSDRRLLSKPPFVVKHTT